MAEAPSASGPPLLRWLADKLPWRADPVAVWYHEAYRLPIHDLREAVGIEPRRADLALWALLDSPNRRRLAVHQSTRASYRQLARVHTPAHLESLTRAATLAPMFGLMREDFPVDAVLATVRLAVGGTIAATRHALRDGPAAYNLLGGFHHAFPDRGAGLCPVNDVAVALATVRAEGFLGRVLVLDLDAHPPDGTAACLQGDPKARIASISGSDWGPLPDLVDEVFLPGADDATYLGALDALLARQERPELCFVLAGGDVLASDRLGMMKLTLEGAAERDRRVAGWLGDVPSVWVPAGGYQARAWRVAANSIGALIGRRFRPISPDLDPVGSRFAYLSRSVHPRDLGATPSDDTLLTQEEVDVMFGAQPNQPVRLLDYYTEAGIEYALHAFGVMPVLRRLGYRLFDVEVTRTPTGDRARLTGADAAGTRHLLWETILRIEPWGSRRVLVLEWMTMRHPVGHFDPDRPRLPGQEVPGLGLAEEAVQLLVRVCERLDLDGVLLRPAWYHTAAMGSRAFRFEDPRLKGELDALRRDLGHLPLITLSNAVSEGRVRRNGEPWSWTAGEMIHWRRDPPPWDSDTRDAAREAAHFSLA